MTNRKPYEFPRPACFGTAPAPMADVAPQRAELPEPPEPPQRADLPHPLCGKHWTEAFRELRADRATSFELRRALAAALDRDPVDAWADAELLVLVLAARMDEASGLTDGRIPGGEPR